MATQPAVVLRFCAFCAFLLLTTPRTFAQTPAPEARITQAVDNAQLTVLKGNVYSLARAEFDRGVAPSSLPMNRMTLVLRPTPEQATALATLLDEQQDQSSPNYHKWLTPAQFGQQFGASEQDIQAITSWLQSQGFQVNHIANGRNVIEFSGTAGQVQQAFHTAIHKYSVPSDAGNEEHWANSTDPQIPTALAPVVVGIATLHNFLKSPQHILSPDKFTFSRKPGRSPEFTGVNGNNMTAHAVTPGDLAIIYNATPLYAATPAIDGTGSTIAVVARSNVSMQDVDDFRNNFGVAGPFPTIVLNGPDPGVVGNGEDVEATLDISYANALAQQANVNFVVSATTNTADGVDLSEMFIIDNNLGDVMTESFGGCELHVTAADGASISNLAQQAAAQGITYLVSTGDSGSAGCDNPSSPAAKNPVSVNVLASTPYTVGVGGTMFNEGANTATYWNTTNSGGLTSARSYIPENVWNESCATGSSGCPAANLAAGSGGVSILFPKPSWQSGVAGIPSTGDRNLPDVSLTAAGHDAYLLCIEGSCGSGEFAGIAGTSASVQAFGGIMGLVRQKIGARLGQADYVFYKLAAKETLANCNGSKATPVPATNCIFYDTTVGKNAVPGITNGDYPATTGYDRATGLGSVNITNLVNQWGTATFAPSVTTLTVTPTTFTHGASATFNITVAPQTGTPSFTNEDVELLASTGSVINDYTLSSTGTASASVNTLGGGSNTLKAHYPGNGTLGSSDSAPVTVVVSPETSTIVASALGGSPTGSAVTTATYGTPLFVHGTVNGQSGVGVPTGTLVFTTNGQSAGTATLDGTGAGVSSSASPTLALGANTISAAYSGDSSFKSSTSAGVSVSVSKGPTTVQVTAPDLVVVGGATTPLSVFVSTTSTGSVPTGTLTLFSGTTQIGAAATVFPAGFSTTANFVLAAASFTVQPPFGANNYTAQYSGDTNYLPSTSPVTTVNSVRSTVTTVATSAPTIQVGQNATFTAQVTSNQPGGPALTGMVQFSVGGIGLVGGPVPLTNGQAQLAAPAFTSTGSGLIAGYSGDTNYQNSTSPDVNFSVTPGPTATISFNPATLSVPNPGASAMTVVTVTGANGYAGAINFSPSSCVGLPAESSCSFSLASVTGSGSTTLTISTTAASFASPSRPTAGPVGGPSTESSLRLGLILGALLLALPVRRRRWNMTGGVLVLALLLGIAACGGGGGGGGTVPTNPGTPLVQNRVITLAVTPTSGVVSGTPTFTLNVN